MSKMIENIKVQMTGRRKYMDRQFAPLSATEQVLPDEAWMEPVMHQYVAEVKWFKTFFCKAEHHEHMMRSVIAELREAIYGDLRHALRELEMAVYEADWSAMQETLRKVNNLVEGE